MLNKTHAGLPAHWYYDPQQFTRELSAIWQQEWICVGRETDWAEAGSYQTVQLGDQQILIVNSKSGLNAFHNTCRHRGARLCEPGSGKTHNGRIVCPYHAWAYDLDGNLIATPRRVASDDFDAEQFPLYRISLETWGGFVFINLLENPALTLEKALGPEVKDLSSWPLDKLSLAHRETHKLNCNWKVFWENFLECYHCPGIHPELCKLVPVYGEGFLSTEDLKAVGKEAVTPAGKSLRENAQTWAPGGISGLPDIAGLSEAELEQGMRFATCIPTVFIVAHRDYVRSVRLMPTGPETTELIIDWLLPEETVASFPDAIEDMIMFARKVVQEDGRACELNQQGLKSIRHQHGVLMPQEYDVLEFNNWVRDRLGEKTGACLQNS